MPPKLPTLQQCALCPRKPTHVGFGRTSGKQIIVNEEQTRVCETCYNNHRREHPTIQQPKPSVKYLQHTHTHTRGCARGHTRTFVPLPLSLSLSLSRSLSLSLSHYTRTHALSLITHSHSHRTHTHTLIHTHSHTHTHTHQVEAPPGIQTGHCHLPISKWTCRRHEAAGGCIACIQTLKGVAWARSRCASTRGPKRRRQPAPFHGNAWLTSMRTGPAVVPKLYRRGHDIFYDTLDAVLCCRYRPRISLLS